MNISTEFWKPGFRVFLSHVSDVKMQAARLKDGLEGYGISAFLAHKDIRPAKLWKEEIKKALNTMEAVVTLQTLGCQDSE